VFVLRGMLFTDRVGLSCASQATQRIFNADRPRYVYTWAEC